MYPTLLVVIFAVELFTVIVNSIGAAAINGLVRPSSHQSSLRYRFTTAVYLKAKALLTGSFL